MPLGGIETFPKFVSDKLSNVAGMIKVNEEVHQYIMDKIYPMYEDFGRSHDCFHFSVVYKTALTLSQHFDVDQDMIAMAAACHDIGLSEGREHHHLVSGRLIRENQDLRKWFTEEQIETIAQAAEDHRASAHDEPRSIYGKIIADADHLASMGSVIRRTVDFSLEHYPDLDREGHWLRCREHLREKYGDGGYLKVWLPEASNHESLEHLRGTIRDDEKLRASFDEIYSKLTD